MSPSEFICVSLVSIFFLIFESSRGKYRIQCSRHSHGTSRLICSEAMCFIEENCGNPMEKLFTVIRVMGVLKYRVRIEREIETENSVANTITYILLQKILQILII